MSRYKSLFDPLKELRAYYATAALQRNSDGALSIVIKHDHHARWEDKRKAEVLRQRYERLLVMQLDVPAGQKPRTVQQLIASGKILLNNGRYVLPEAKDNP